MADEVLLERNEGWAEIILNRPATRNDINGPLGVALAEVLTSGLPDRSSVWPRSGGADARSMAGIKLH